MITKPTWVLHSIIPEDSDLALGEFFGNIHTHGLDEYGHKELCIALGVNPHVSGGLLNALGMSIANDGLVLKKGIISGQLAGGFDLKIITFKNDPTLYVILPDPNNRFPGDTDCDPEYAKQEIYAKHISETQGYV